MTDTRSLEPTMLNNLLLNKARLKFVARFLLALYAMRTIKFLILAASLQRFAFASSGKLNFNLGHETMSITNAPAYCRLCRSATLDY